ncbi:MAG: hypothetical protein GC152_12505 [Alphaproteobacteria bacterium]|nr:hypothetical protein [Alphaproteobacteria bacterium]
MALVGPHVIRDGMQRGCAGQTARRGDESPAGGDGRRYRFAPDRGSTCAMQADRPRNLERDADARADRRAIALIGCFLLASFLIEATSIPLEAAQAGRKTVPFEPWVREAASHAVTFGLVFLIPRLLDRAPLTEATWRSSAPVHVAAFAAFSTAHIIGFVAIRKALYPALFGYPYEFGLGDPWVWVYEARKDLFAYAAFVLGFQASRAFEQRSMELSVARATARADRRLTLKCGGRTFYLDADDIVWAKAAANYVDIGARAGDATKVHLARMTLASLERLLADAGAGHVRIHRSCLVARAAIAEVKPVGDGDLEVRLATGETFPVSRSRRAAVSR